jgi:hypothetical protein
MITVKELPSHLEFVSDSQDVQAIREDFSLTHLPSNQQFDSFFVGTADGDYTEVWGMFGIVPYNDRHVYAVKAVR